MPFSNVAIGVVLYLTVEIGWNETQFLLGGAVVKEQPFTLSKGVECLHPQRSHGGLVEMFKKNELVGSL